MLSHCTEHNITYDLIDGCPACMGELAIKRINIIRLLKALVEDWLPQIPMTLDFRDMFYKIIEDPPPEWLDAPRFSPVQLEWITENKVLVKQGVR